jgi:hypothetical protein
VRRGEAAAAAAVAGELVVAPLGRVPGGAERWAAAGRRCWRQLRQVSRPDSAGVRGDLVGFVAVVASVVRGGLVVVRWGLGVSWSPPARPGASIGSSSGLGNARLLQELSLPIARLPRRSPLGVRAGFVGFGELLSC